jgi:hypothetical protein
METAYAQMIDCNGAREGLFVEIIAQNESDDRERVQRMTE